MSPFRPTYFDPTGEHELGEIPISPRPLHYLAFTLNVEPGIHTFQLFDVSDTECQPIFFIVRDPALLTLNAVHVGNGPNPLVAPVPLYFYTGHSRIQDVRGWPCFRGKNSPLHLSIENDRGSPHVVEGMLKYERLRDRT